MDGCMYWYSVLYEYGIVPYSTVYGVGQRNADHAVLGVGLNHTHSIP